MRHSNLEGVKGDKGDNQEGLKGDKEDNQEGLKLTMGTIRRV